MALRGALAGKSPWKTSPPGRVHTLQHGDIVCCDALDMLMALRDDIADIVFLDPPFNLGKQYGNGDTSDRLPDDAYLRWMRQILDRSVTVLKQGGALYLYHLPRWAIVLGEFLRSQMTFRHWIAISMKGTFARGDFLYPAHYALLYFTKGKPTSFRRPKVEPPRCRSCKAYIRDYGGYKKYVARGINLSDVWDDLSPVRHHAYKHRIGNELPLRIPERVVQISGKAKGVFVDPFAGSGTTLVAAAQARMRFMASDIDSESCRIMVRRLGSLEGTIG